MIEFDFNLFGFSFSHESFNSYRKGSSSGKKTHYIRFWIELLVINDYSLFMIEYDMGNWKFDLFWLRILWFRFLEWRENRDG
jgi:hypothetical protein